jgi:hypothetical protein
MAGVREKRKELASARTARPERFHRAGVGHEAMARSHGNLDDKAVLVQHGLASIRPRLFAVEGLAFRYLACTWIIVLQRDRSSWLRSTSDDAMEEFAMEITRLHQRCWLDGRLPVGVDDVPAVDPLVFACRNRGEAGIAQLKNIFRSSSSCKSCLTV